MIYNFLLSHWHLVQAEFWEEHKDLTFCWPPFFFKTRQGTFKEFWKHFCSHIHCFSPSLSDSITVQHWVEDLDPERWHLGPGDQWRIVACVHSRAHQACWFRGMKIFVSSYVQPKNISVFSSYPKHMLREPSYPYGLYFENHSPPIGNPNQKR